MTDATENWRYVPHTNNMYAVSDLGRVWSYHVNRLLKPGRMTRGHMSVALTEDTGAVLSRCVHELVLIGFVGPCPVGHEARHHDGVPSHNALSNLSWATYSRNIQDKKWHDGQRGYKLKPAQVVEIRAALEAGATGASLARQYGVCQSTITNIRHNRVHVDVAA